MQDGDEGFKPMTAGFRLEGIQGSMAAHVGHTCESGRHCALVVLVCSEAFPEGLLDGAVFHWAVASREGGTWSPPPDGWQSDPSRTSGAGRLFWYPNTLCVPSNPFPDDPAGAVSTAIWRIWVAGGPISIWDIPGPLTPADQDSAQ